MSYTPDPTNALAPLDSEDASSAAAEFRALKAHIALLSGITSTPSGITSINGGQLAGQRNKIINGAMEIAQRGTSLAAIPTGTYLLDRWIYTFGGALVATVSQQLDAPSSNEFQYSLRHAVTTVDAAIAAGDFAVLTQRIEGYNVRDLIGRTFTLSFWVRGAKTGVHNVAFRNQGNDRSYVAEYTINAINTWEYKTVTVTGGLITAGTWNWTNSQGLYVDFPLYAGSTFHTTAGTWQTGNFLGTAAAVQTEGDTIGNIFALTGVQLEIGGVATAFEHRNFQQELAMCQRYFWKTYNYDIAPGFSPQTAGAISARGVGSTITAAFGARFKVSMRATPTVTLYNTFNGTSGQIRDQSASTNYNATAGDVSTDGFSHAVGAGDVATNFYQGQATASAEL